uniref:Uncharacterized protein n=1 Tax=Salix viminalis TaxID=40686 RepID=A0A6N2LMQ8_SALVM
MGGCRREDKVVGCCLERRLKSTSQVLFKKRLFGCYQTPKLHPKRQTPDAPPSQTGKRVLVATKRENTQ